MAQQTSAVFAAIVLAVLAAAAVCAVEVTVTATGPCRLAPGDGSSAGSSVLSDALQLVTSDTVLYLESGVHCIEQFALVNGVENIVVQGKGDGSSVNITCANGVGLAFVNVTNLAIENVVIEGCSLNGANLDESVALLNETVRLFYTIPSDINIAVFLGHCENLRMENVTITNTRGIGLVGVNVVGQSALAKVEFSHNIRPANECSIDPTPSALREFKDTTRRGGGAYFLYQDYRSLSLSEHHHTLDIKQSRFVENSECSYEYKVETSLDSRAVQNMGHVIGGGGGLTVVLAQQRYGIDVTTTNSLFRNNTATSGGGTHLAIFAGVRNSRIVFDNCTFLKNGFSLRDLDTEGASFAEYGGALEISYDVRWPESVEEPSFAPGKNLTVRLRNTSFSQNGVRLGGGAVDIYSLYLSPILADAAVFYFDNCTFDGNIGITGAAMSIVEIKWGGRAPGIQIEVKDCTVTNSEAHHAGVTTVAQSSNQATISIYSVNFTLQGTSVFSNNMLTALQGFQSLIGILGEVYFGGNSGVYGGALSLVRYTYLVLAPHSALYIRNNVGMVQGGALFVNLLGGDIVTSAIDCFLYFNYEDFDYCDNCSNLNSTGVYVELYNNQAPAGGIVYGSALRSCPWGLPFVQAYKATSLLQVLGFFPHIFNITPTPVGVENIITPPQQLSIENIQSAYRDVPGGVFNINLSAYDNFDQNIRSVVSAYALNTSENQPSILDGITIVVGEDGLVVLRGQSPTTIQIQVFSKENQNVSAVLFSTEDAASGAEIVIDIEIGTCPKGFVFNNDTRMCDCRPELVSREISCDISSGTLIVQNNLWVGPVSTDGDFTVHSCVNGYCEPGTRVISVLNETAIDYDSQCAAGLNRGGLLCGRCQDSYSIILGSNRCLRCHNRYSGLFALFLLLGALLVVLISFFQITITAGLLNGALFYSNIISLYNQDLIPADPYDGRLFPTSWLTLSFGLESCLYDGMTSLEKVLWQLSFPLYLLLLMLLITFIARYCKWERWASFSITQTFATLILLCYVSVLGSCAELLGPVHIKTVNGDSFIRWFVDPTVTYFRNVPHGLLASLAILLLVFYIIPLPLFLLVPSVAYRVRYLNKLKPFYDAFWDPFEPKYRFWLGLRLIFRWIPFSLAIAMQPPVSTFFTGFSLAVLLFLQQTLRPFKSFWRNVLDGFFLLNMVIVFMGSVYFNALAESNRGSMRDEARERATIFTTIFVSLAYVAFLIVLFYHFVVRFPKLKAALLDCIKSCRNKKKETAKLEPVTSYAELHDKDYRRPRGVTASVVMLREPLLDDLDDEGSVELVSVHPEPEAEPATTGNS